MKTRTRPRLWFVFVSAAVLFHLLLFICVKPSHFFFLIPSSRVSGERSVSGTSAPDAIVYVPVELEEEPQEQAVTQLVEETESAKLAAPTQEAGGTGGGQEGMGPFGFGDMVSDASRPLAPSSEIEPVRIPPRPLQITWPDTRKLKNCLGHQVDIRVQVDEDGRILELEPATTAPACPPECVRAALECGSRIVFAPGRINGRAARMWTEIRIDFRERR